jgi:hypothetical protein
MELDSTVMVLEGKSNNYERVTVMVLESDGCGVRDDYGDEE